ncbi:helix-turn-helix domain-containing protein [Candidatus Stoquefichus sp. SB1]|uniref:helix-turn-helix domain-containing protein n=1 Tax=Candidatus Stoquefichus sp. SB1 TaxID=1658109 RepID=UPI00067F3467|nr:helix-turn-helix transcriptional regulator [Candidatus Stoquefichus sp. SB1]
MGFGKRLKKIRKDRGYTQIIVEKITGIDRSTISAYERGERKPSYDNLIILARLYKVSIDYLCGNSERRFIDTTDVDDQTYYKILILVKDKQEFEENII